MNQAIDIYVTVQTSDYIVVLKNGSEIVIEAHTASQAMQEARERGLQPAEAVAQIFSLRDLYTMTNAEAIQEHAKRIANSWELPSFVNRDAVALGILSAALAEVNKR